MTTTEQIKAAEYFVKEKVFAFDSGHDWWHVQRVRKLALYINMKEYGEDPFLVEITSLLHDAADSKFTAGGADKEYDEIAGFLRSISLGEIAGRVIFVIRNISFSNNIRAGNLNDPVLMAVQDADRLDALGAIGIARAFSYGGYRKRLFFEPDSAALPGNSTISHFYEKLLKLKDMMNTSTGRIIAAERHDFMEKYLDRFFSEWYWQADRQNG